MAMLGNKQRPALHSLAATLRHRGDLLLYDIDDLIEDFVTELSSLRTDALAPFRTAFVGHIVEDAYRSANGEYGMSGPPYSIRFSIFLQLVSHKLQKTSPPSSMGFPAPLKIESYNLY